MYSNLFVCLFGIGTVFTGLICIILLTKLMSVSVLFFEGTMTSGVLASKKRSPRYKTTEDTDKITAAIVAAIALEEHVDFSEIKVLSLRKL